MQRKTVWMLVAILMLAGLGVWFFSGTPAPPPVATPGAAAPEVAAPDMAPGTSLAPAPPQLRPIRVDCRGEPRFESAAAANTVSLSTLAWAPFRRPEIGWETYAPFVAREIATTCEPGDPAFAAALAQWQDKHKRPATGVFAAEDFELIRVVSHRRRPFVIAFANGCPVAAEPTELVPAAKAEGYSGKAISLRGDVLDAYRRMVAAAKAEVPAIALDPRNLTIFSGYRPPEGEAARCAGKDCTGPARVLCSAHRTGTALDIYVGEAPGLRPDTTDDRNRLFQSKTPTYRWLVANADRFGFFPYVFEPWHWEWAGAPAAP